MNARLSSIALGLALCTTAGCDRFVDVEVVASGPLTGTQTRTVLNGRFMTALGAVLDTCVSPTSFGPGTTIFDATRCDGRDGSPQPTLDDEVLLNDAANDWLSREAPLSLPATSAKATGRVSNLGFPYQNCVVDWSLEARLGEATFQEVSAQWRPGDGGAILRVDWRDAALDGAPIVHVTPGWRVRCPNARAQSQLMFVLAQDPRTGGAFDLLADDFDLRVNYFSSPGFAAGSVDVELTGVTSTLEGTHWEGTRGLTRLLTPPRVIRAMRDALEGPGGMVDVVFDSLFARLERDLEGRLTTLVPEGHEVCRISSTEGEWILETASAGKTTFGGCPTNRVPVLPAP